LFFQATQKKGPFETLLKFLFGEIYFSLIKTELQVFNKFNSGVSVIYRKGKICVLPYPLGEAACESVRGIVDLYL